MINPDGKTPKKRKLPAGISPGLNKDLQDHVDTMHDIDSDDSEMSPSERHVQKRAKKAVSPVSF